MKAHKAMIIALIVICITAVTAVLVTGRISVRFASEPGRRRSRFSQPVNLLSKRPGGEPSPPLLMAFVFSTHPIFS